MGDLNCNLLTSSLSNTKLLSSFCYQLKMTELVCSPTRITDSSVSQLDVILTNTPDHFHQTFAIPFSISDHHLILTHLSPRGLKKPQPPKYIKTCNYRKLDLDKLHKLMNSDALEHITHMRNLDNSVESFTHFITAVMNKVLPEKTLRMKQNSLPWAREPDVCEARIKRNLAHRKGIKCNTPEAWCNYRGFRTRLLLCSGLPNPPITIIWLVR